MLSRQRARSAVYAALAAILVVLALANASNAAYPDRPISIVVHTKAGGAIDLTARVVAQIARRYTDVPLVVENRYGGSGAVAMRAVLDGPPDGYMILAVPATFVSTVQITQNNFGLDDFYFLACLTEAPEALITNRDSDIVTFEDIVSDARAKKGRQIWVGPGVGSLDHLMAVKTWEELGITATWVPYDGGGAAIAALLGQHGAVYVGNPEDVKGRPDLNIAVVSSRKRLKLHPDVPTFLELGYDLPHEIMWRGFAVRKGTPPDVIAYLEDLLRKISQDEEWLSFVEKNSADAVFYDHAEFTALVDRDSRESVKYLRMAKILAPEEDKTARRIRLLSWLVIPVTACAVALVLRIRRQRPTGPMVVAAATLALAGLFFVRAFGFPEPTPGQSVGPATVPFIWSALLAAFSVFEIRSELRGGKTVQGGRVKLVLGIILLMIFYITLLPRAGFFIATAILIVGGVLGIGYRRHLVTAAVTLAVIAFCYVVFVRILGLPLPQGSWFQ